MNTILLAYTRVLSLFTLGLLPMACGDGELGPSEFFESAGAGGTAPSRSNTAPGGTSTSGGTSAANKTQGDIGPTVEQPLAASRFHTCALINGGVHCWGTNFNVGMLGNNSTIASTVPVAVVGLTQGVVSIDAGSEHTCALVNGGVQCWGENWKGQLGDNTDTDALVPVQVVGLTQGVSAISAGGTHACAVVYGGVQCWGIHDLIYSTGVGSHVPLQVNGLTEGVTAIAAGKAHTCAVVNGGVTCWGSDQDGQFSLDEGFVCGKKCDAECDHAYDGDAPDDVVSECSRCTFECNRAGILAPIEGLSKGVTAIAAGNLHTCALFNGGVQCWGDNASGQLGDGSHASRPTPRPVAGLPSGVEAVTAGVDHSCVLANGGVYCWGSNLSKQLGAELVRESLTPIQVNGLTHGVTAITAGAYHTCAIVSGTVQCWGANDDGQLGNNDRNATHVPVTVEGLPTG